ncbi:hypothetical protein COBT_003295 [Conglomerata obtusa]
MANLEESQMAFQTKTAEIIKKKLCRICFKQLKQRSVDSNILRCSGAKCRKLKSFSTVFSQKPFFNSKLKFEKTLEIIHLFFLELKIKQIEILTKISKTYKSSIIEDVLYIIKKYMKKKQMYAGR